MKQSFSKLILLCCPLFAMQAYASENPIGWSLSPSGGFPAQTTVGNSYALTYVLTNNTPVAVPVSTPISYTGGNFTINENCNGVTLQAHANCQINIGLTPLAPGHDAVTVTIAYGNTRVPLPTVSTTATGVSTGVIIGTPASLPANVQVGASYPVTFTYFNNSIFPITATSVDVSGFTASSNSCTLPIQPKTTCSIIGNFSPSVAGKVVLSTNYHYQNNGANLSVPLSVSSTAFSSGSCKQVIGSTSLPLPTTTYIYSDNVVKFTFTNPCVSDSQTLGTIVLSATLNGSNVASFLTKGTVNGANDTCSNTTLAPQQTCNVYVNVRPTQTGSSLLLQAHLPYNAGTNSVTSTSTATVSAIPNIATQHNVIFINQCNFPVWYEFQNGTGVGGKPSPDPTPSSARSPSDYQLLPELGNAPYVKVLPVNTYVNGVIYGRTDCNSNMVCATASCPVIPGTGTCQTNIGAGTPTTGFESNMTSTQATDGVYDVSVINGMNVPVEIKGLGPVSSANPFACGGAGALIQPLLSGVTTQLGACSWKFTPPNGGIDTPANYYFVSAGANDNCSSSASCGSGQICGMGWASNIDTGAGVPINRRCGTFQGFWTIADMIGYNATSNWGTVNLYNLYQIGSSLSAAYGSGATNYNLYGCKLTSNGSLNSGYQPSKSNVCGCYNWDGAGSPALTNASKPCCVSGQSTPACGDESQTTNAPNALWQSTVFDRIKWLKSACPTAYSYQYDDPSSQFTCNKAGEYTSYEIVFCPGGKTGNPAQT